MGIDLNSSDVRQILDDSALVEDIVKGVIEDPVTLDGLAEEIADELSDVLGDDPDFRAKVIEAAIGNKTVRARLVTKLAEEFSG